MARWELKTDYEKGEVTLDYVGNDRVKQNCGKCEVVLRSQLLDWMFSPGQVDAYDIIVMDGQEFFAQPRRARA